MDPTPITPETDPTTDLDWRLAHAAARGDERARADFWQRYSHSVRLWLWFRWCHTSRRNLIDDAAQEVFLECFRPGGALAHLDRARAHHGLEAYLRGVVRNVACRIERAQARDFHHRRSLAAAAGQAAPEESGSAECIDRARAHDQVLAALDLLDREDRQAGTDHSLRAFLRAHFEQGQQVRTIAAAWQEQVDHVHEVRRRACQRFRDCLLRVMHGDDHAHRGRHAASHRPGARQRQPARSAGP